MPFHAPYVDQLLGTRTSEHLHLGYFAQGRAIGLDAAAAAMDDLVVSAASVSAEHRVLDLACGFGGTLARLDRTIGPASLTGVNIDARQLAIARGALPSRVSLVHADACALPFGEKRFDRVVCIEAAFHFSSRVKFLAEIARVLARGSRAVLTDFEVRKEARACGMSRQRAIEQRLAGAFGDVSRAHRDGSYRALAPAAGLAIVRYEDLTEATLPSYGHMLSGLRAARPRWPAPVVRGLRLLGAASRAGVLRYVMIVIEPNR